uniref:Mitochondrial import inner membrane translocase subunit TIM22-2-like n=1 Tax=Rhizophora mucronata TaxID=61149 RepID=A0A2P2JB89_RHIMU
MQVHLKHFFKAVSHLGHSHLSLKGLTSSNQPWLIPYLWDTSRTTIIYPLWLSLFLSLFHMS